MFIRIFKHLLPHGRAWRLTVDRRLRQFFEGLAEAGSDIRSFYDLIWFDIFPDMTRDVSGWESQFGLRDTGLTAQQRRDRLSATWRYFGGQSPGFIQDTLRANGFDVYVHEWWDPGTEPTLGVQSCATPRNPLLYLRREYTLVELLVECGEAAAQCGEAFAECGNRLEPSGYLLVNKILQTVADIIPLCGEAVAACGEEQAGCGLFSDFRNSYVDYIVPNDAAKWPYFLYIGGETFGDLAQVDPKRKDEFEALCLKICPAQQWLGMLVEYV